MRSHLDTVADWNSLAKTARYRSSQLAQLCRVSPRQLQRFFRRAFKRSPQTFLDDVRLNAAPALLLGGSYVKEVSHELGFAHPSHFIKRFRRRYGSSPLSYAVTRSNQQRVALEALES
jgi:AraC family transcriptional regulator